MGVKVAKDQKRQFFCTLVPADNNNVLLSHLLLNICASFANQSQTGKLPHGVQGFG